MEGDANICNVEIIILFLCLDIEIIILFDYDYVEKNIIPVMVYVEIIRF